MVLEYNPAHIIHEQIISTGRKLCIGHSACYSLPVSGRQMPRIVQVIYLNKFPKIAYVKNDTNSHYFKIYSLAALMFATIAAVWGLSVLFR